MSKHEKKNYFKYSLIRIFPLRASVSSCFGLLSPKTLHSSSHLISETFLFICSSNSYSHLSAGLHLFHEEFYLLPGESTGYPPKVSITLMLSLRQFFLYYFLHSKHTPYSKIRFIKLYFRLMDFDRSVTVEFSSRVQFNKYKELDN